MYKLLCVFALVFGLSVPALAQDKAAEAKTEPKTDPKSAEPEKKDPKTDVLRLYRTVGNTWTFKLKDGTFEKHEVSEVTAKRASVKLTSLDKNKKETAFDFYSVALDGSHKASDEGTPSKSADADYKAGEITLACVHAQYYASGGTLHIWKAKDWHIVVKEEWVSKSGTETRRELVEFNAK